MPGTLITQVAFSVPFESEPERSNGFTSKNSQEAIEEALELAVSNDRFPASFSLPRNANTGKILDLFTRLDSFNNPFLVPTDAILRSATLISSRNSTGTIGIYKNGDLTPGNEIATVTLNNDEDVITDYPIGGSSIFLSRGDKLTAKVICGSIRKPGLFLWFNATTSSAGI